MTKQPGKKKKEEEEEEEAIAEPGLRRKYTKINANMVQKTAAPQRTAGWRVQILFYNIAYFSAG